MKIEKNIYMLLFLLVACMFSAPSALAEGGRVVSVVDGYYTIASGINTSKMLDVSGAGIGNGTNIQIWSANNTFAQRFYIEKVTSDWYSIRNIESRKAVDVTGGSRGNEVNVQLYDWNGTDAQLWQFQYADNGFFYIKNRLGYYLDAWNNRNADGTNVQTYQFNGGNNQKWKLSPAEGIYTITSRLSNSKRLDVSGAGTANGTNIHLWSSNNTVAQLFCLKRVSGEWFSILNVASRKAVDVRGGKKGNEVNVQLYDWNKTDAQLWRFESAGNGYYYVRNRLGYYLDVWNNQTSDGTNVQTYQYNGGMNQMWRLDVADLTQRVSDDLLVTLYEDGVFTEESGLIKLMMYYTEYNHNRKYDIKREARWNELFTDFMWPGTLGVIKIQNQYITPEQLGNIIYGLSGRVMGFSDRTIYQGGGYAASGSKYLNDPSRFYGDSQMDHEFISIGINMGRYPGTIDIDLGSVPGWVLDAAKGLLK